MTTWDTEGCKDVFRGLSAYNMGLIKKAELKRIVNNSGVTEFTDSIGRQLADIFKPAKRSKAVEVEPSDVDID